jgi:hypothetical protein
VLEEWAIVNSQGSELRHFGHAKACWNCVR